MKGSVKNGWVGGGMGNMGEGLCGGDSQDITSFLVSHIHL